MKPLQVWLLYDSKTKDKASEIFKLVKENYKLNHTYHNSISTPLFSLFMCNYYIRPFTYPDIIIMPERCRLEEQEIENVKIIYYNEDEEIKLWDR